MFTRLINIENAKIFLACAQLYDEILVGTSLSTCDHRPTSYIVGQLPTGARQKSDVSGY